MRASHLLLALTALSPLVACERGLSDAADALPTCERACVVHPQGAPVLELSPKALTTWDPTKAPPAKLASAEGFDAPLKALEERHRGLIKEGKPIPAIGYLFCHRDTPGARLSGLLGHASAASWKAVALAGRRDAEVGFVTLAVWRGAAKGAKREELERAGGASVEAAVGGVEACEGGAVCPLLEVSAEAWTCGELVELADALQARGRLIGVRGAGSGDVP